MWPRALMLTIVLLVPCASLAAAACCDEVASGACCEPEGRCPDSGDGECDLVAAGEALGAALPDAPIVHVAPAEQTGPLPWRASPAPPTRRAQGRTPLHLLLQTFRN